MSRFLNEKFSSHKGYVPGEQPQEKGIIKLNTNESPFGPSELSKTLVKSALARLNLYSDPKCTALKSVFSKRTGIEPENIIFTNGSDEALLFAFYAFCAGGAAFPDITYGFYPVLADFMGISYRQIPLGEDFTVNPNDYCGIGTTAVLANPNAQTGLALEREDIRRICLSNPDNVVIVDEAYVDFGGESCLLMTKQLDNLVVTGTFSKSRSLAGARLGFAVANAELIRDMELIKDSINPYNVNSMTAAAAIASLMDEAYYSRNIADIKENRGWLKSELELLGFTVPDSKANFLMARHDKIGGRELYERLYERKILVRHFAQKRIEDYVRITVSKKSDCEALINELKSILKEAERA